MYSKQCLRDKQERQRKKRSKDEARLQQAADAESKPEDHKARLHNRAESVLSTTANSVIDGDTIEVKPKNAKKAALLDQKKDQGKKRKADDDTASIGGNKKQKKKEADNVDPPPSKKKKEADSTNATSGKKRKEADNGSSTGAPQTKKNKKKEEQQQKKKDPKGPVDVERQCGVLMPNGALCARSLTCKSHAMGLKRAVPGRSLPYDYLLSAYQKKNQAKQQKAAMASAQPLPEDLVVEGGPGGAPVDSDEERDAVMAGIRRAAPRPIFERPVMSARDRYGYVRMKEQLSNALGGVRGGSLFSTIAHQAPTWVNSPHHSRASSVSLAQQHQHPRQMSIN